MTISAPAYSPVRPASVADRNRVVVGIDDHPASVAALRFAAAEAAYRGVDVAAVHVWHFPSTWGWAYESTLGPQMLTWLQQMVTSVLAERAASGEPVVAISAEVVEGDAAAVLQAAAGDAALLVLGARHHNRLLGSVSQAFAGHPPCPVVIVPTVVPAS